MALNPLRINFGVNAAAPPWWVLALFAAGFASCAWGVWRLGSLQAELVDVRRAIAQKQDLLALRSPVRAERAQFELPADEVRAINRAIVKLNLPWRRLFAALEAGKPANVALLALEPDPGREVLRVVAEVKQADDMLAFVDRLAARPEFAGVALVKHEINDQDPNRPYRFQLEARWKDPP